MFSCCKSEEATLRLKAEEFALDEDQILELVDIMKYLGLSWNEVDRIHASFSMLDLDSSNVINREEMIESLGTDKTVFAFEAFNVFDKNHDGTLDFVEFLVASTKLCCADPENLCRFAFRLVDQDNSGSLEYGELQKIVNVVYGEAIGSSKKKGGTGWRDKHPQKASTLDKIVRELDKDASGTISADEFVHVGIKFPQLIEPAYQFRNLLRKKVVNPTFWSRRERNIRERIRQAKDQDEMKKKITFSIRSVRNYHNKYLSGTNSLIPSKKMGKKKVSPN